MTKTDQINFARAKLKRAIYCTKIALHYADLALPGETIPDSLMATHTLSQLEDMLKSVEADARAAGIKFN